MIKKSLLAAAAAALILPVAANAQTNPQPGFYIGAEGGLSWLLNNNSYSMDTGWAAGGKMGYDFVGPRIEVEGLYHSNTGSGNVAFPGGVVPTARALFNDEDQYNGLNDVGARDQFGNAIALLSGFTVTVAVTQTTALTGIAAAQARQINVTVRDPTGLTVVLTGYRANF